MTEDAWPVIPHNRPSPKNQQNIVELLTTSNTSVDAAKTRHCGAGCGIQSFQEETEPQVSIINDKRLYETTALNKMLIARDFNSSEKVLILILVKENPKKALGIFNRKKENKYAQEVQFAPGSMLPKLNHDSIC